jgi:hypothetical protein
MVEQTARQIQTDTDRHEQENSKRAREIFLGWRRMTSTTRLRDSAAGWRANYVSLLWPPC